MCPITCANQCITWLQSGGAIPFHTFLRYRLTSLHKRLVAPTHWQLFRMREVRHLKMFPIPIRHKFSKYKGFSLSLMEACETKNRNTTQNHLRKNKKLPVQIIESLRSGVKYECIGSRSQMMPWEVSLYLFLLSSGGFYPASSMWQEKMVLTTTCLHSPV